MPPESTIDRKLGYMEKFSWLGGKLSPFNFVVHATVMGNLSEESLRFALDTIQKRHPLLRARIVRKGWNDVRFESENVPRIPLRIIDAPEESWIGEAESELNLNFATEEGPLLRCVFIRHKEDTATLLLTFHHAIGDAMSGAYLIRDLIRAAERSDQGIKEPMAQLAPKRAAEDYIPPRMKGLRGALRFFLFILRIAARILRWGIPALIKRERFAPMDNRKIRIIARELDPAVMGKLQERTRRENTTVNGALFAAHLAAIARERKKGKNRPFLIASPINMREYLSPPIGEDVGLYAAAGFWISRAAPQGDFWRLARDIRESLQQCVDRGEQFVIYPVAFKSAHPLLYLFGANRLSSRIYMNLGDRIVASRMAALSNIGTVDIESSRGGYTIKKIGFAAAILSSYAATIDDFMAWNFVGIEPIYSKEQIERIADAAVEILKNNLAP